MNPAISWLFRILRRYRGLFRPIKSLASRNENVRFASIGSGNCDTETRIALSLRQLGIDRFSIHCIDLNPAMLKRGEELAKQSGLDKHIITEKADFNRWRPQRDYDAIIAHQSLHHVVNLERLFDAVKEALTPAGLFIISDMIGRNGHQRWPEALAIVEAFWNELPQSYRHNRLTGEQEDVFINRDCSVVGFEGIRAQDVLPLLIERFSFDLFLGFSNVISPFIDRCFGPNFNVDNEWDRDFIDRVHARDESELLSGSIKPTQMMAVVNKQERGKELCFKNMSPAFCVRDPSLTG